MGLLKINVNCLTIEIICSCIPNVDQNLFPLIDFNRSEQKSDFKDFSFVI